jgi:hypothetical protein
LPEVQEIGEGEEGKMLIPSGLMDLDKQQLEEVRDLLRYISKQSRSREEIEIYFGKEFMQNAFIRLIKLQYINQENNVWSITEKGKGGFKLISE